MRANKLVSRADKGRKGQEGRDRGLRARKRRFQARARTKGNWCENARLTDFAAQPVRAFEAGAHYVIGILHQSLAAGALVVRTFSLAAQVVRAGEIIAHNIISVNHWRGAVGALVVGALCFAANGRVARAATALRRASVRDRGGAVRALEGAAEHRLFVVGKYESNKIARENIDRAPGNFTSPNTRYKSLGPSFDRLCAREEICMLNQILVV